MLHKFVKENNKNAIRSWEILGCDACNGSQVVSYFYIIKAESPDEDGMIDGGYICQQCGFSNAGKCHVDLLLK